MPVDGDGEQRKGVAGCRCMLSRFPAHVIAQCSHCDAPGRAPAGMKSIQIKGSPSGGPRWGQGTARRGARGHVASTWLT